MKEELQGGGVVRYISSNHSCDFICLTPQLSVSHSKGEVSTPQLTGKKPSRNMLSSSSGMAAVSLSWLVMCCVFGVAFLEVSSSASTPSTDDSFSPSPVLPHAETGSMHRVLADYMTNHHDVRSLTVHSPFRVVRRKRVTWTMEVSTLGEYGEGYNLLVMKPLNSYEDASWNGTFPCVLVKGSGHTSCRGSLPSGANSEAWRLILDEKAPARWNGQFPSPPTPLVGEPEAFVGKADCESLSELVLARAIQRGARYVGKANVTCQRTSSFYYVVVDGPTVHFQMQINAAPEDVQDDDDDDGGSVVTKTVSWRSSVDSLGHLVVSDGLRMVAYTKESLLGDHRVKLFGKTHDAVTYSDINNPEQNGEPRLCNSVTMTTACFLMKSLTSSELTTVGSVIGFNMQHWNRRSYDGAVSTQGYVLGTSGVLFGQYTATTTAESETPEWTEVPLRGANGCSARLYNVSDCQSLPDGAPVISAYQRVAVTHLPFPDMAPIVPS